MLNRFENRLYLQVEGLEFHLHKSRVIVLTILKVIGLLLSAK